jgi:hypothetical protein
MEYAIVMILQGSFEEKGSLSAWMGRGEPSTISSLKDFGEPLNMRMCTLRDIRFRPMHRRDWAAISLFTTTDVTIRP